MAGNFPPSHGVAKVPLRQSANVLPLPVGFAAIPEFIPEPAPVEKLGKSGPAKGTFGKYQTLVEKGTIFSTKY